MRRFLDFIYDAGGRLNRVQDSAGRQVLYGYAADGTLTTFTDAASRVTTYSYVAGRFSPVLSQVRDPWNRVVTSVTFYQSGKLQSLTEAGETYTYAYPNLTNTTTKTDSSGK